MDQKFKTLAKTCKIFPKDKKIFKNKSKNQGGNTCSQCLQFRSRLVSDNPMGKLQPVASAKAEIRHVFGDTLSPRALPPVI
mgnify:CR=1 FL=1